MYKESREKLWKEELLDMEKHLEDEKRSINNAIYIVYQVLKSIFGRNKK